MALSSLTIGIYVLLQGVPANHWTAVETDRKMRLFQAQKSHLVPFSFTYYYLSETCDIVSREPERGMREGRRGRGTGHFGRRELEELIVCVSGTNGDGTCARTRRGLVRNVTNEPNSTQVAGNA